jgi:serine/threonine-protein kinase
VVAYELLGGRHPFAEKTTAHALFAAHLVETPVPLDAVHPGLPPAVVALVMRCLAKAPDDRPANARDVVELLGSLTPSAATLPAAASRVPSIAVLPFVNLSADPENEYFSDGISEEVLNVLAQDRELRVAARSSSFAFKGRPVDLRTMAAQLHVATLLEGSVRRAGNRVRITAQLVNAADGYQLWSARFDRELTDIFAVQDEIAGAIADTLRQRLRESAGATPPPERGGSPTRRTHQAVSVEAYEAYLKGRYARHLFNAGHEALAHYQRALALAPEFSAAHVGVGESYFGLGFIFAMPPAEAFAHARRHAQRALALEPDLADAHLLLAQIAFWFDWDAEAGEWHAQRARALEPHHAGALMTTAFCLNARGRPEEALAAADAAVRADPLGMGTRGWYLGLAFNAHRYDLLNAEATRLVAEQPSWNEGHAFRAMAAMMTGDLASARADLDAAGRIGELNQWTRLVVVIVAALAGDLAGAHRARDELLRPTAGSRVPAIVQALAEQMLGDYEAAFAWYERAYQERDCFMAVLHTDPTYCLVPPGRSDAITADPRWADLVRRVGLAR